MPPQEDGLPAPRRSKAAGAVWLALMAVSIELMAMSVALPAIAASFHASPAAAIWVVKAYQLGVLLTLLPFSALGERIGYRRVYEAGLLLYAIAALGCLAAPSLTLLILCRAIQGIGMSGIVSVNGALMRHIFPHDRLARAFATNALIVAAFGAAGPSIASLLIAFASWHWIFVLSAPLCGFALLLGLRSLPDNPRSPMYDGVSAALYAGTLGMVFLGTELMRLAAAPLPICAIFAAGAATGIALFGRSRKRPRPLLPVDLLRSRLFLLSILTSVAAFAAQTLAFVTLPFLLPHAMPISLAEIGPLMMAWPIAVGCAAPLAGRLAGRIATSTLAGTGLALMAAGLALMLCLPPLPALPDIGWRLALCGFGFGFFQAPNNHAVLTAAPIERAGAAAGMQAIARHLGQIAGASLAAAAFSLAPDKMFVGIAVAAAIAGLGAATSLARRLARASSSPPEPA